MHFKVLQFTPEISVPIVHQEKHFCSGMALTSSEEALGAPREPKESQEKNLKKGGIESVLGCLREYRGHLELPKCPKYPKQGT